MVRPNIPTTNDRDGGEPIPTSICIDGAISYPLARSESQLAPPPTKTHEDTSALAADDHAIVASASGHMTSRMTGRMTCQLLSRE